MKDATPGQIEKLPVVHCTLLSGSTARVPSFVLQDQARGSFTREGHTFRHATRGPNQIRQWGHSLEYAHFTLKLHHMKHKVLT